MVANIIQFDRYVVYIYLLIERLATADQEVSTLFPGRYAVGFFLQEMKFLIAARRMVDMGGVYRPCLSAGYHEHVLQSF